MTPLHSPLAVKAPWQQGWYLTQQGCNGKQTILMSLFSFHNQMALLFKTTNKKGFFYHEQWGVDCSVLLFEKTRQCSYWIILGGTFFSPSPHSLTCFQMRLIAKDTVCLWWPIWPWILLQNWHSFIYHMPFLIQDASLSQMFPWWAQIKGREQNRIYDRRVCLSTECGQKCREVQVHFDHMFTYHGSYTIALLEYRVLR